MLEYRKIQCKFNAQAKKFISLQAAIKELLSVSVKKIELCSSAVEVLIKGLCATASRLLKR